MDMCEFKEKIESINNTIRDIINKFDGILVCGDENLLLENFSKDTRTIKEGDIYVGIKGASFDGNNFYQDAFDKGASACILDNIDMDSIPLKYKNKTIIVVDNSLECIQKLAKYKRSLYNIPVVAITGSVGKTSTKDMVASVLATKYCPECKKFFCDNCIEDHDNFNQHISINSTGLMINSLCENKNCKTNGKIEFYCGKCKLHICANCKSEHKKHQLIDLFAVVEDVHFAEMEEITNQNFQKLFLKEKGK